MTSPAQQLAQPPVDVSQTPDLLTRGWSETPKSFWAGVWREFSKFRSAIIALWLMSVMAFVGVFAPFLANHRPFVLSIPDSISDDAAQGFAPGLHFPLLAALRDSDWLLIFGFFQALFALLAIRRASRNENRLARPWTVVLSLLAFLPIAAAFMVSPGLARANPGTDDPSPFASVSPWVWSALGAMALAGLSLLLPALPRLLANRADELGALNTPARVTRVLIGSLLMLPLAAQIGTLGQLRIDTVDYWRLAHETGVRALFAPIQHDYLGSQTFAVTQRPGAPFVRVSPTGGSQAAADLGLTDNRKDARLSDEIGTSPVPLTPQTPLSSLRMGQGVRTRGDGATDFFVIARDFTRRFPIAASETSTIGDLMTAISESTGGRITATLAPDASRILLSDAGAPRPRHWLGTDQNGSDVAARIIHATRVALSIGFVSTGIAVLIGISAGALMGYFGGWIDILGMRIIEIFMAIPTLFLLLTIIAFIPPEWNDYLLYAMMAVIGLTSWMVPARFIRAEFLKLRDMDYIQAATACGLPLRSILFKHMLPNGVTPVLVHASFGVALAILTETALSFLGFGIKPPNPSWGQMLFSAVDPSSGVFYWWLAIFPGIMIFTAVFSFNLIGDALRDAIDPRARKAAAI